MQSVSASPARNEYHQTSYSLLETLLLCSHIVQYGETPTAFSTISASLQANQLLTSSPSFEIGRLSPDALRERWIDVAREEGFLSPSVSPIQSRGQTPNGDGGRKRRTGATDGTSKASGSKGMLVVGDEVVRSLTRKLMDRYRTSMAIAIKEDEVNISKLSKEIGDLQVKQHEEMEAAKRREEAQRAEEARIAISRKTPSSRKTSRSTKSPTRSPIKAVSPIRDVTLQLTPNQIPERDETEQKELQSNSDVALEPETPGLHRLPAKFSSPSPGSAPLSKILSHGTPPLPNHDITPTTLELIPNNTVNPPNADSSSYSSHTTPNGQAPIHSISSLVDDGDVRAMERPGPRLAPPFEPTITSRQSAQNANTPRLGTFPSSSRSNNQYQSPNAPRRDSDHSIIENGHKLPDHTLYQMPHVSPQPYQPPVGHSTHPYPPFSSGGILNPMPEQSYQPHYTPPSLPPIQQLSPRQFSPHDHGSPQQPHQLYGQHSPRHGSYSQSHPSSHGSPLPLQAGGFNGAVYPHGPPSPYQQQHQTSPYSQSNNQMRHSGSPNIPQTQYAATPKHSLPPYGQFSSPALPSPQFPQSHSPQYPVPQPYSHSPYSPSQPFPPISDRYPLPQRPDQDKGRLPPINTNTILPPLQFSQPVPPEAMRRATSPVRPGPEEIEPLSSLEDSDDDKKNELSHRSKKPRTSRKELGTKKETEVEQAVSPPLSKRGRKTKARGGRGGARRGSTTLSTAEPEDLRLEESAETKIEVIDLEDDGAVISTKQKKRDVAMLEEQTELEGTQESEHQPPPKKKRGRPPRQLTEEPVTTTASKKRTRKDEKEIPDSQNQEEAEKAGDGFTSREETVESTEAATLADPATPQHIVPKAEFPGLFTGGHNTPSSTSQSKQFAKVALLLMDQISSHKFANTFAHPVKQKSAPNYNRVIYHPQDIRSIKAAIQAGKNMQAPSTSTPTPTNEAGPSYSTAPSTPTTLSIPAKSAITKTSQLEKECLRMFANACMYNKSGSQPSREAIDMSRDVERQLREFNFAEKAGERKALAVAQAQQVSTLKKSRRDSGSARTISQRANTESIAGEDEKRDEDRDGTAEEETAVPAKAKRSRKLRTRRETTEDADADTTEKDETVEPESGADDVDEAEEEEQGSEEEDEAQETKTKASKPKSTRGGRFRGRRPWKNVPAAGRSEKSDSKELSEDELDDGEKGRTTAKRGRGTGRGRGRGRGRG